MARVNSFRMREAAALLGVSDDTLRRWAEQGRLATVVDGSRKVVEGAELARFAKELAESVDQEAKSMTRASARNRFTGLVTNVIKDAVMTQVELQAGPFRVVSLISREAADELELAPGVLAVASIKATNVVIEVPR